MSHRKATSQLHSTSSLQKCRRFAFFELQKCQGLEEPSVLLPRGAFKHPPEVEGRIFKLVTQDYGSPNKPQNPIGGGCFFVAPDIKRGRVLWSPTLKSNERCWKLLKVLVKLLHGFGDIFPILTHEAMLKEMLVTSTDLCKKGIGKIVAILNPKSTMIWQRDELQVDSGRLDGSHVDRL